MRFEESLSIYPKDAKHYPLFAMLFMQPWICLADGP